MTLSVVIPTFNRPDGLNACLASLAPQFPGGSDTGIVVVDDLSSDPVRFRNAEVCRNWNADYLLRQGEKGVAACRNDGIRHCKGSWIAFLDDDVRVSGNWYRTLMENLPALPSSVIGIEGTVLASGDGVWDREVQNLNGGLFLTCHVIYRKELLNRIDGFDEAFKGPYGEDHELAIRAQKHGAIIFIPSLVATHEPRDVNLLSYFCRAPLRMSLYLKAEHHFAAKHPDHYRRMRHARTFWGTYASVVIKNVSVNLRRRTLSQMVRHPLQSAVLLLSCVYEQIAALFLLPGLLRGK